MHLAGGKCHKLSNVNVYMYGAHVIDGCQVVL